ncbi:MAG: antitoxin [Myxococcales bacterium]|nr:antitoxin [Myxococcales bacterium]
MESHISATEAARSFSELLNRVRFRGDSFVVERGGEAVCRISPIATAPRSVRDLIRLLGETPKPDKRYLDDLERITRAQPKLPSGPWES